MHNIPDYLKITPEMQQHFAKGGMIKRADGSYSRRGLWDNIRANRGSGRKPTKEMLEQEAKIRAEEQYGGVVDQYGNGGYTVRRSNARKGKTHVVIGPDGTKKYFGDSKLGQHPNDPARKKAFYARHKHNLEHNPYFRAFARATWKDGGEIPTYASGTSSVNVNQLSADSLNNWNKFHQYAVQQGVNNDQSYNTDPSKGKALLAAYNAANPQNVVNENMIPAYQQYFQNLSTGNTAAGNFGKQVTQNWQNGVSQVDNFIGTQTMNSFAPVGRKTVRVQQPDGSYKIVSQTNYNSFTNNVNPITNTSQKATVNNSTPQTNRTTTTTPTTASTTPRTTVVTSAPPIDLNNYTTDSSGVFKPRSGTGQNYKIVAGKFVPYNGTPQTTATAQTKPAPSQPIAQTNTAPVPGMQTATLAYGGYYQDGGNYGPFYGRRDAAKLQRWRNPTADSMTPSFFAMGGLNKYQDAGEVNYDAELAKWKQEHGQPTYSGNGYLATANYPNNAQFVYNAPAGTTFGRTAQAPAPASTPQQVIAPVVAQEPAGLLPNVELMDLMPTRGLPAKPAAASRFNPIPVSTSPSYLERTYESTEGIPKTVLQFFDTESHTNEDSEGNTLPVNTKVIFDKATNKAYKREYNESTGKFKILAYPIAVDDPITQKALLGDVAAYTGDAFNSTMAYNESGAIDDGSCAFGQCGFNRKGQVQYIDSRTEYPVITNYFTDKGDFGKNNNFMTIDSSKSFDDNIGLMKQTNRKIYDLQKVGTRVNEEDYKNFKKELESKLGKSLTKEQEKELREGILKRQQGLPFDENLVRMPSHEAMEYYIPEFQDLDNPNFEQNKRNEINYNKSAIFDYSGAPISLPFYDKALNSFDQLIETGSWKGDDDSKTPEGKPNLCLDCINVDLNSRDNVYDIIKLINEGWSTGFHDEQMKQKFEERIKEINEFNEKRGGLPIEVRYNSTPNPNSPANKKFRNGGRTLGRYQVGNQVVLNQQQPGVYNLGQMGPGDQGNYQPTNYVTNIGQQQAGNQNIGQQGPAQTVPQTANSGQGVNTTTSAVNPATGPFVTNIGQQTPGTQNLGQLGPAETAPKGGLANLIQRKNSIKSGLQQGYNNFKNSVAENDDFQLPSVMGNEGYGQNMKVSNPETPATADNTKTATTPTSKNQPSLSQTIAQMNHGLNGTAVTSGDTEVVDQGLQDYFNSKNHQFLQGVDQVQSGLGRLARGITSINPNSQNAAVLGFDRRMNDTLTNRMTITAPRKGIEYAKYGGRMSLKEGEELDLSTEQIHQLEKLGYKFQIL